MLTSIRITPMKTGLSLLSIAILIAGCELIGPSEEPDVFDVSFRLEDRQYEVGDSVQAVFVNASTRTVYRVQYSCRSTNVQKLTASTWTTLRSNGAPCYAKVSYYPVESGEVQQMSLPTSWFQQRTRTPAGTYRFAETVAPTRNADTTVQVTSETFTIGEDKRD